MPRANSDVAGVQLRETKLQQFSSCFKNEADLRVALIALLEKLPNTWGVRHTHGTAERGKDIIFRSNGPFATEDLVACVVKNNPITGSVDSDDGARTVYHQAEQSLDTPILNNRGEEEYATRAFIITPYDCSPAALDSVKGKLARADGVVRFLVGRELYELFERYYPDYLVFRSGLFGTYISDLETGLSQDSAVANLLMKHGLSGKRHDISKIYVQPSLEVNIVQFHLTTEWPQLPSQYDRLLRQDVVGLGYRYRAFGEFIEHIAEESEAKTLGGHMRWLAQSIQALWKEAYKQYESETQPLYRSEQSEIRRVGISLPGIPALRDEFERRAVPAKSVFNQFLQKLGKANELAATKPITFSEFLRHPARLDYSYIKGIAAQMPTLIEESDVAGKITTTSQELMDSGEDALITAPAGFGKTSFCRWNVLNDLAALKEEKSNFVPLLIPLHEATVDPSTTPSSLFFSGASLAELWSKRRSSDGKEVLRRFRLYLDGLDEVPDIGRQRAILALARELKDLEPTTHIVLTGRDHVAGSHLNAMSRLQVAEMSDAQISELLDRWFSDSAERKGAFKEQFELVPSLKPAMRVPLLATLVLSVYESTSTLPESRIRLYDMFIVLMAGGWDTAKRVHRDTQFGSQPKITVLQYLAGRLHLNGAREATAPQFNNAVRTLLPALEDRSAALLQEIVHDGLLVPVANGHAFSHLSFQEYLAAKDLMEPRGTKASEALARYLRGEQWWKEVVSFYVALSGQPKEMESFIRAEALKVARKTADRQILQRTVGLLREIAVAYPGARPDYEFPQWPKLTAQHV
jgi:hypothetical protein